MVEYPGWRGYGWTERKKTEIKDPGWRGCGDAVGERVCGVVVEADTVKNLTGADTDGGLFDFGIYEEI
jgi:hypothetical protein